VGGGGGATAIDAFVHRPIGDSVDPHHVTRVTNPKRLVGGVTLRKKKEAKEASSSSSSSSSFQLSEREWGDGGVDKVREKKGRRE